MIHESGSPAMSVHAHSPPFSGLTFYDRTPKGFVARDLVLEVDRSFATGTRAPAEIGATASRA
jgi:hypothetical protein